jgi:hydroxymethylpyrimidine/phosphomethylpyrimidine kinase
MHCPQCLSELGMKKNNYPCVLTVAGSDSSGGAGIQADIKVISAIGCYAASVITALTAQNTQGVQAVYTIPAEFVAEQINSVFSDLTIAAVKIGMLHNENCIAAVAGQLKKFKPKHIVLDPVMIAKSGHALLQPEVIDFFKKTLLPHVTLVTPNIFEIEKLLGIHIQNQAQQENAARALGEKFQINVLVKGGHMEANQASDVLYVYADKCCYWFHAERIQTQNTHGTGCSLSSAIAAYLAKGYSLQDAINKAKNYLTGAIQSAQSMSLGHGAGPVDHFYRWKNFYE